MSACHNAVGIEGVGWAIHVEFVFRWSRNFFHSVPDKSEEEASQGPGEGADPIAVDEAALEEGIEVLSEFFVQGDLQEEGAEPDDREQDAGDYAARAGMRSQVPDLEREFGQHDRCDDPAHPAGVFAVAGGALRAVRMVEHGVVDELHEPDHASHVGRGEQVQDVKDHWSLRRSGCRDGVLEIEQDAVVDEEKEVVEFVAVHVEDEHFAGFLFAAAASAGHLGGVENLEMHDRIPAAIGLVEEF